MTNIVFAAIGALAIAAGAASAQDGLSRQIPIDGTFGGGEGKWTNGRVGYQIVWRPILVNGQVEVCGAVVYPDSSTRRASRDLVRRLKVYLDGQVIMRNMRFFEQPNATRDIENATMANCRPTGIARTSLDGIRLVGAATTGRL